MDVNLKVTLCSILMVFNSCAQSKDSMPTKLKESTKWQLVFEDEMITDWHEQWTVDGLKAHVTNDLQGMHFKAGPEWKDDTHHAVLWTKQSFTGDLKIEFDYTRTDKETNGVNIIYIQATGTGEEPYVKDISVWNKLRTIPSMRTYFDHMNALHISYAAFENTADTSYYIRARRYPKPHGQSFDVTKIPPSYDNRGYFKTGRTYHITIIKTSDDLVFKMASEGHEDQYTWNLENVKPILEGKIGLRHMYTRSARYKNFKIYQQLE